MRQFFQLIVGSSREQRRALLYGVGAIALMLVYLQLGSRGFFIGRLAPGWVEHPLQLKLWAPLYQFAAAWLLFFLLPVVLLKTLGGETLSGLGLGAGKVRAGLVVVSLGLVLLALPGGWLAAKMADFRAEYPLAREAVASVGTFILYQLAYGLLFYLAWEFFFRGVLQLGLSKYLGVWGALLFQTACSTLLHIGKPWGEVWAALAAGVLFGLLVMRLQTVWPLVMVHWGLGAATDFFCAGALGYFG